METTRPRGRVITATRGIVETPESLHLQPKAKAKSKANAKTTARGGSRAPAKAKVKKVELTKPVLPYHDIMNDGYYVKA